MRILIISYEYPPETGYGGIATYSMHLSRTMAARGHTVHVICCSPAGSPRRTTEEGVVVHRVTPGTYPLPTHPALYRFRKWCRALFPRALVKLAWSREVFREYRRLLDRGERFDIVEYPECGGEGLYTSRDTRCPAVARLHTTPWGGSRELIPSRVTVFDRMAHGWIERTSVNAASAVSSPSHAVADMLAARWKIRGITVIPNLLPVQRYTVGRGTTILFTGRVEHRKGVHLLIQAYARARPPAPLVLAGRPYGFTPGGEEYGRYIERLIRKHRLERSVHWHRGVDHSRVASLLNGAAVGVFPSLWENCPYACLEAMASGIAVVAGNCGGLPEMIDHGESGLLFDTSRPEELGDILGKLLADRSYRRGLGERAREKALARYDVGVVGPVIEQLYERIRANHGRT